MKNAFLFLFCLSVTSCGEADSNGFLSDHNEFVEKDNLFDRVFALGAETSGDNTYVYVAGTTAEGDPLSAEDVRSLSWTTEDGSVVEPESDDVTAVVGDATPLMTVSYVSDYSGSMSDGDIEDTSDIFTEMASITRDFAKAEVVRFSDSVDVELGYTTNYDLITSTLLPDEDYERGETLLYDAWGQSWDSLSFETTPMKVLAVATDGMDSGSIRYVKEELVAKSNTGSVFVIMLGNQWAEAKEMEDLAGPGVFLYSKKLKNVKEKASLLANVLGSIYRLEVPTADLGNAEKLLVDGDRAEFRVP